MTYGYARCSTNESNLTCYLYQLVLCLYHKDTGVVNSRRYNNKISIATAVLGQVPRAFVLCTNIRVFGLALTEVGKSAIE